MAQHAIGIDFGGTNFRLGMVDSNGQISDLKKYPVKTPRTANGVVEQISSAVHELLASSKIKIVGVGVGMPGIVDFEEGMVLSSPHYPEWKAVPFRRMLSDVVGLPVFLDNDANLIALGEKWMGAAKEFKSFIMLTLGTGIGGGLFFDGKLWRGEHGFAGEIGHMTINYDGAACSCGGHGCWELYASATGLTNIISASKDAGRADFLEQFGGDPDSVTSKRLYDAAKDGSIFASVIWKKFGSYLGAGMASVVNALGVHDIIIGGGVSDAWELFIEPAKKEIRRRTYTATADRIRLHRAILGDSAGILGAVSEVFKD